MLAKLYILLFGCVLLATPAIDLTEIRTAYRSAAESEVLTKTLFDDLTAVGKSDDPVLIAYKGAVGTMMAAYADELNEKKQFFKDGRELLEYAVATAPDNVEIRCIRLSVQENVPKITGYRKNQEEDKAFILQNYASMKDADARAFVKGFAGQSESFTESERQSLSLR